MSCMFDKDIIQKYADNTIDPLEFIFLKEHIGYCEECRRETELAMALESSLESFFSKAPGEGSLDSVIAGVVDDCMYELNRGEKLKFILNKRLVLSGSVFGNSLRFFSLIPGSGRVKKGMKRAVSGAGGYLKSFLKKEAEKLLEELTISI